MIRVTMVPLDAALGSQETSRLEKQRRGSSQQATPEQVGKNSNSQALLSVSLSLWFDGPGVGPRNNGYFTRTH